MFIQSPRKRDFDLEFSFSGILLEGSTNVALDDSKPFSSICKSAYQFPVKNYCKFTSSRFSYYHKVNAKYLFKTFISNFATNLEIFAELTSLMMLHITSIKKTKLKKLKTLNQPKVVNCNSTSKKHLESPCFFQRKKTFELCLNAKENTDQKQLHSQLSKAASKTCASKIGFVIVDCSSGKQIIFYPFQNVFNTIRIMLMLMFQRIGFFKHYHLNNLLC